MKNEFTNLKTFEDLCHACGATEQEFLEKCKTAGDEPDVIAYKKIRILSKAINQGWEKNTLDTHQYKWFPWFWVSSSGLVFSDSHCGCDSAVASVGFPFCFESKEKSDYAGRQFIKLWEEFIL